MPQQRDREASTRRVERPVITHQPTPEQLERLEQARLAASHTDAAIAEHSETQTALNHAIDATLYGAAPGG
jgi:hypothetical protein